MQKKEQTENKGFQQIATLTAATKLTVPAGARMCRIEATTQAIRWRDDGTAPTTTVGMLMNVGDILTYDGTVVALTALRFIEVTASAKLNVSYYS